MRVSHADRLASRSFPQGFEEFDAARDRAERRRALAAWLGWLTLLPLLCVAALRLLAHDATLELIALNALTPWLYLPAWAVLAASLALRRRRLLFAASLLALLHVFWLDPRTLVTAEARPVSPSAPRLRVMSANLLMVNTDTEGIVGEILEARPDLLLVQELSPHWQARLDAPDLRARLPHRHAVAREDSFGIGIYSRLPIEVELLTLSELPAQRARLRLQQHELTILNVHTLPPRTPSYVPIWRDMMAQVAELVRAERGPLLLAGDLNTTPHHRWYGRLLSLGLRGAHEDRGRGWATTWPNGRFPLPPIRLDHFLVSPQVAVLSVTEGIGRGSDHRPIVADLALD